MFEDKIVELYKISTLVVSANCKQETSDYTGCWLKKLLNIPRASNTIKIKLKVLIHMFEFKMFCNYKIHSKIAIV